MFLIIYLVLLTNIGLGVLNNFLQKKFSIQYGSCKKALIGFNVIISAAAAIMSLVIMLQSHTSVTWHAFAFGIPAGLCYFFGFYYHFLAFEEGVGVATASLFIQASLIAPIVVGWFVIRETIYPQHILGIVLLVIGIYIILTADNAKHTKSSLKGIWYLILALLANAIIGICQKLYPYYFPDTNTSGLSFSIFLCAFLSSIIIYLFSKGDRPRYGLSFYTISGAEGIITCVRNLLTIFLASRLAAAIQFPVSSSLGLTLTTIMSVIVFKEKISVKKGIGIVMCIIGSVYLGLQI